LDGLDHQHRAWVAGAEVQPINLRVDVVEGDLTKAIQDPVVDDVNAELQGLGVSTESVGQHQALRAIAFAGDGVSRPKLQAVEHVEQFLPSATKVCCPLGQPYAGLRLRSSESRRRVEEISSSIQQLQQRIGRVEHAAGDQLHHRRLDTGGEALPSGEELLQHRFAGWLITSRQVIVVDHVGWAGGPFDLGVAVSPICRPEYDVVDVAYPADLDLQLAEVGRRVEGP
jgi:hypothetical protein